MTDRLQSLYDNARTQTFSYNGAKITVRESLGIDKMDMAVYRRFVSESVLEEQRAKKPKEDKLSGVNWNRVYNFVEFAARTVSIKGKLMVLVDKKLVEFKLPTRLDDENIWQEAYWVFLYMTNDLIQAWDDALIAVNKTEPDPEVLPGDEKSTTNT